MPTTDRRPRTRRRTKAASDFTSMTALRTAITDTHADDDAWRGVRSRVARFLAARVGDTGRALAIADVYHRRPELMGLNAPRGRVR